MKPKKKAKELLKQHTKALFNTGLKINKELVRTSALLCIDEFLNFDGLFQSDYYYWDSVKKHINKL